MMSMNVQVLMLVAAIHAKTSGEVSDVPALMVYNFLAMGALVGILMNAIIKMASVQTIASIRREVIIAHAGQGTS